MSEQLTKEQKFDALHAAWLELALQQAAVVAEMNARGSEGKLWTNSECAAWSDYEAALNRLDELRDEYLT